MSFGVPHAVTDGVKDTISEFTKIVAKATPSEILAAPAWRHLNGKTWYYLPQSKWEGRFNKYRYDPLDDVRGNEKLKEELHGSVRYVQLHSGGKWGYSLGYQLATVEHRYKLYKMLKDGTLVEGDTHNADMAARKKECDISVQAYSDALDKCQKDTEAQRKAAELATARQDAHAADYIQKVLEGIKEGDHSIVDNAIGDIRSAVAESSLPANEKNEAMGHLNDAEDRHDHIQDAIGSMKAVVASHSKDKKTWTAMASGIQDIIDAAKLKAKQEAGVAKLGSDLKLITDHNAQLDRLESDHNAQLDRLESDYKKLVSMLNDTVSSPEEWEIQWGNVQRDLEEIDKDEQAEIEKTLETIHSKLAERTKDHEDNAKKLTAELNQCHTEEKPAAKSSFNTFMFVIILILVVVCAGLTYRVQTSSKRFNFGRAKRM